MEEVVREASVYKLRGYELGRMKIFSRPPLPPGLLDPEHEGITIFRNSGKPPTQRHSVTS
jgi:hypothetical protein